MYSNTKFILWLFISLPLFSTAQFNGGSGDGYTGITENTTTLDNQSITVLYQGSNGDGYDVSEIYSIILDNTSLTILYTGGNGDGYDKLMLNAVTLDNTQLENVYTGGSGDGFSLLLLPSITLDNTSLLDLYAGGSGDGFDQLLLSANTLDNTSLAVLYTGGFGDGYTLDPLRNITLENQALSVLFEGGNGDGFSNNQEVVYLDPTTLCLRSPQLTGTPENSDLEMSSLSNSNATSQLNNAFLVLISKEKGFVITRISNPEVAIGANAVEGMIVYDTNENCIKLYNGSTWNCIIQRCPD